MLGRTRHGKDLTRSSNSKGNTAAEQVGAERPIVHPPPFQSAIYFERIRIALSADASLRACLEVRTMPKSVRIPVYTVHLATVGGASSRLTALTAAIIVTTNQV